MNKSLKKYFPVFVLPTLIAFIIAFVAPFIMGVGLSFTKFTTVTNAQFVGLDNYIKIFTDPNHDFLNALIFTTLFTIVSIITVNIIAFSLAMLLTRKMKGTNFFRSVFFLPNLIGGIVLGYIWQLLINGVLDMLVNSDITKSSTYGFWGLVLLNNWQLTGKSTQMLALDIYKTFYGRIGWAGVGQAKAVIFFIIVALIAFLQLRATRSKEVEQ